MNRALRITVLFVLLSMVAMLSADYNSADADIRMGLGARALSMGSAASASVRNVTAAYWNPAGLANLKGIELAGMYSADMGIDRTYNFGALGMKFNYGTVAVSWINANMTDFEEYDDNGTYVGSFDYNRNNIALSYATTPHRFKLGITGKMSMSDIGDDSESGYGFDAGIIYDISDYMGLSCMIRDAYATMGDDDVPFQLVFGAAIYPYKGVTLATDFRKNQDEDSMVASFGAEYWATIGEDPEVNSQLDNITYDETNNWSNIMSQSAAGIRVGMNDGNLTGGIGVRFNMIEVGYAFVKAPEDFLNDSHHIQLTLKF